MRGGFGPGWGYGYPPPYYLDADYLFDDVDAALAAPPAPEYEIVEEDGKMILKPRVTVLGKGGGHHGGHGMHHGGGRGLGLDPVEYEVIDTPTGPAVVLKRHTMVPTIVFGMIDTGAWAKQMNTLKQVPVSVARIMAKSGLDAITRAQAGAKQPWYVADLPGETRRNEVAWKLRWHDETLAKLLDNNAMYASGDDLKKWVLNAYLEANAVEEGAGWIATAWGRMWNEITAAIAALPKIIAAKVNETAASLFGLPGWAVGLGAVGLIGLLGYTYVAIIAKGHSRALGGK